MHVVCLVYNTNLFRLIVLDEKRLEASHECKCWNLISSKFTSKILFFSISSPCLPFSYLLSWVHLESTWISVLVSVTSQFKANKLTITWPLLVDSGSGLGHITISWSSKQWWFYLDWVWSGRAPDLFPLVLVAMTW